MSLASPASASKFFTTAPPGLCFNKKTNYRLFLCSKPAITHHFIENKSQVSLVAQVLWIYPLSLLLDTPLPSWISSSPHLLCSSPLIPQALTYLRAFTLTILPRGFAYWRWYRTPLPMQVDIRDTGSIPRSGRSPGGGHSNPLQCSCPENFLNRGVWWVIVHGVAESDTTE